jgi:hypothetical protein
LREREMTAFKLLEHMTKVDAAATIGVSLRELDKLVETYETAKGLESVLPSPESAITWARELVNVSPKFRTPQVVDELKNKVEKGLVVNSKDVRALRNITPNPKALAKFLEPDASVEDALAFTSKANNKNKATQQKQPEVADDKFGSNLTSDLLNFSDTVRGYSWSELAQLLEDPDFRKAFTEAKAAISQLETLVKM